MSAGAIRSRKPRYTDYEFPEWLYEQVRWRGYLRMFNLFAVQEAGRQFWAILGLKQAQHGIEDSFAYSEADRRYDAVRAHEKIVAEGIAPGPADPAAPVERFAYTTVPPPPVGTRRDSGKRPQTTGLRSLRAGLPGTRRERNARLLG